MSAQTAVQSPYETKAGTILQTKQLTEFEKYFEIALPNNEDLLYTPGQFVMVMVHGVGEVPISISSSPTKKGSFELVIRKAGRVTQAIHNLKAGDVVGIRGPYGRGFPIDELRKKDIVFVGGGCGNIPLHSLITYVLDNRKDFGKVNILIGCKNPNMRLFVDEVQEWAKRSDVKVEETVDSADESWKGRVGLITTLIPTVEVDPATAYACIVGPPIMYKFVIKELLKQGFTDDHIILSLERHMKCGVGKCGHCQIGEFYCCQDGPVFTYKELKGKYEAL